MKLNDRERIMLAIIRRARFSLRGDPPLFDHETPLVAGDLVLGGSHQSHEWSLGYYVKPLPVAIGGAVIREIGTGALCNYVNERFTAVRGIDSITLLEGAERAFYTKVIKAINSQKENFKYRFDGIRFHDGYAVVTIRPHIFASFYPPFDCVIKWTSKTPIKSIVATLRAQGFGSKFEGATS